MTPVLKATGISVRFGGVRAVVDVDLEVGEGQLVGLIGPNGAGKTTFIDAISGFVRCDGRVELDGEDLTGVSPHVRARRGLARTWQSIELFDDLSVGENLLVASHRTSAWRTIRETVSVPDPHSDEITPALALLGVEDTVEQLPSELSQGQRKLVGIARALVAEAADRVPRRACRRPGHARERGARRAACAAWPTTARRCSSSTTTWVSCSGSATRWSCSSSAR